MNSPAQSHKRARTDDPAAHFDEYNLIKLEWPGWKSFTTGQVDLGGMGPCTGIALIRPAGGLALVCHVADPKWQSDKLDEMLAAAERLFPDKKKAKVFVTGCNNECDADDPDWKAKDRRRLVLERLSEAGFDMSKAVIEWGVGHQTSILLVDVDKGRAAMRHYGPLTRAEEEFLS